MTDAELWASFWFWMAVAAVVVLIAAGLLIYIWMTAQGIRREALRALAAVEAIHENTGAIWALQATNEVAANLAKTVESIQARGGALMAALETRKVGGHAQ
jgi:hypothetical protein